MIAKTPLASLVFVVLFLTYAYFMVDPIWNGWSHMDLTRALVEDHTARIDRFQENTGDKSRFQGHYYSDKPPGLSLLAVPGYAAYFGSLRLLYGAAGARQHADAQPRWGVYVSTVATVTLLSAVAGTVFFSIAVYLTHDLFKALFATAAYGLGSLAFPFSTLFFSHQLTGSLLFVAFALLFSERRREPDALHAVSWRWPVFLAGLAAGYATVTELSAAIPTLILGVYAAAARSTRRTLWAFLAGGGLAASVLVMYNFASFRSPFALGYSYLVDPTYAKGMSEGFMGLTFPKPAVLYEIILGLYRGLVPLSPVVLVAAVGAWRMWKEGSARLELMVGGSIVAFYFLFNASYVFWDGGWSFGPRHVVPMLAFLYLPIAFGIGARPIIAGGLLALSVLHMLLATTIGPLVPTDNPSPLLLYVYPRIVYGFIWSQEKSSNWAMLFKLDGYWVLVPLLVMWTAAAVIAGIRMIRAPSALRTDRLANGSAARSS